MDTKPTTEQRPMTVAAFFRITNLLFGAFLFGVIANSGVIYYMFKDGSFKDFDLSAHMEVGIYSVVSIVFAVLMFIFGRFIFQQKIRYIQKQWDLPKKLAGFFQGFTVHLAFTSIVPIMAFILFAISDETYCFLVGVAAIIYYFTHRVTARKVIDTLDLNESEKYQLRNPK